MKKAKNMQKSDIRQMFNKNKKRIKDVVSQEDIAIAKLYAGIGCRPRSASVVAKRFNVSKDEVSRIGNRISLLLELDEKVNKMKEELTKAAQRDMQGYEKKAQKSLYWGIAFFCGYLVSLKLQIVIFAFIALVATLYMSLLGLYYWSIAKRYAKAISK